MYIAAVRCCHSIPNVNERFLFERTMRPLFFSTVPLYAHEIFYLPARRLIIFQIEPEATTARYINIFIVRTRETSELLFFNCLSDIYPQLLQLHTLRLESFHASRKKIYIHVARLNATHSRTTHRTNSNVFQLFSTCGVE